MATVFQVSAELGAEFTGEAAFDEAVEAATAFAELPELLRAVRALERRVGELEAALAAGEGKP